MLPTERCSFIFLTAGKAQTSMTTGYVLVAAQSGLKRLADLGDGTLCRNADADMRGLEHEVELATNLPDNGFVRKDEGSCS